jgi:ribosomal protein S15P/S13E
MATTRAKRPRPVKSRTLPPDETSLISMIRTVHRDLAARAEHLEREPHDNRARRGVQVLHDQRSNAWNALNALNPGAALAVAAEINARPPRADITNETEAV